MIAIVDYGMGNLRSVQKALEHVGLRGIITNEKRIIKDARAIIVPGVGAFHDAMNNLRELELVELIGDEVKSGKTILGICLGMQLFYEWGYEVEKAQGFSFLKGDIIKIPAKEKIPHMGWNQLDIRGESQLLKGINKGSFVYFVHSYYAEGVEEDTVKATTHYGIKLPAIVEKDNVFGLQFHPEKSSSTGLRILDNFRQVIS